MADSLTLSISVSLARLPEFVSALAAHLEPDTPCTQHELLALPKAGKELPLTLRFAPDAALIEFQSEHADIVSSVPHQVALGYLFATARECPVGLEINFFSSSRAIVQVLRLSEQVRSCFLILGSLGSPQEVRVTDEWNDVYHLSANGVA